jgi:hypothetical protein
VPSSRFLIAGYLAVLAAALNLWNNDFPLGYHLDEGRKVDDILGAGYNFYHPLLMIRLGQAANALADFSDRQLVAVLGRSVTALAGALSVPLMYLIAGRTLTPLGASIVALGAAVSPILAVHAHYLKEDTLLTTGFLASLLSLLRMISRPTIGSTVLLGASLGIAFSSHYKSILLVPLCLAAPLFLGRRSGAGSRDMTPTPPREGPAACYLRFFWAGIIATALFVVVNWPLVHDFQGFLSGVRFEATHALEGHDVRVGWRDYWMAFHLLQSLAPGVGWWVLAPGLAGLALTIARWRTADVQDRVLAAYAVLLYVVPELSPLKPYPDFGRYMMPVAPVLIYFAWRFLEQAGRLLPQPWPGRSRLRTLLAAAGIAGLVLLPLVKTWELVSEMGRDTRVRAADWLAEHRGRAVYEFYTRGHETPDVWSVASIREEEAHARGIRYLVASSFVYGRYELGQGLAGQSTGVYATSRRYARLFQHPYVEFRSPAGSYAFSNPVIRIVDIGPGPGRAAVVQKEARGRDVTSGW